jgi:hypothetical protein
MCATATKPKEALSRLDRQSRASAGTHNLSEDNIKILIDRCLIDTNTEDPGCYICIDRQQIAKECFDRKA